MGTFTLRDSLRFARKVLFAKVDECWEWRGAVKDNGYGNFYLGSKTVGAHRVAYTLTFPDDIEGKVLRHTCDNRRCVNPRHLVPGTYLDNREDMLRKGRQSRGPRHAALIAAGRRRAEQLRAGIERAD